MESTNKMKNKVEYYTIRIDSQTPFAWVYSADGLQDTLGKAFAGSRLTGLFVHLHGYLDSKRIGDDRIDFSYMGGTLLLVSEQRVLELRIHANGLMEYRILPRHEVHIPASGRRSKPPADMGLKGDPYYYDLGRELDPRCLGQGIQGVAVPKTDAYPFHLAGFDEELAAEAERRGVLPDEVAWRLENGFLLRLCGSGLEYFDVRLERA